MPDSNRETSRLVVRRVRPSATAPGSVTSIVVADPGWVVGLCYIKSANLSLTCKTMGIQQERRQTVKFKTSAMCTRRIPDINWQYASLSRNVGVHCEP